MYSQVHVQKLEGPYPHAAQHLSPPSSASGADERGGDRAAQGFSLWGLTSLSTHELFLSAVGVWGEGDGTAESSQDSSVIIAVSVLSRLADARSDLLYWVCLLVLQKALPHSPLPS